MLVAQRDDGPLSVSVPREFSFDVGSADVKPALGAVLDKVADSLRRTPAARLRLIAAPADASSADTALALRRATRVREQLLTRRTSPGQLGAPAAANAAAVQLRMELVAAP